MATDTLEISESRARVLDAAEKLFMERGYASVTMRHIADALGMKQAALYYHAPNGKEQLYREVVNRHMSHQRQGLEKVIAAAPPTLEAQLSAITDWLVEQAPVDLMRMVRSDAVQISESYAQELIQQVDYAMMQPITNIIRAAQERGEVRRIVPEMVSGMLLALTNWAVYFDSTNRFSITSKMMMRQVIELMLNGMIERSV
ncbi:MAG: TetR family transcriptional regulator [Anaerolineaceae bacterium]|nr:TetR family transcriptional regulator [Anaerolineaceae bacterium]